MAFIRIGFDRFKVSSVSSYSFVPRSNPNTGLFYVKVMFGRREHLFGFATEREAQDVVDYLDSVLKCLVV